MTQYEIYELLESDGSWLTSAQIADRLEHCSYRDLYRKLRKLSQYGQIEVRLNLGTNEREYRVQKQT